MNNKLIYIPTIALVLGSILLLTIEIDHYNTMIGFGKLLALSIFFTFLFSLLSYRVWINEQNGEDQYVAMGSTVLFGFVVILALVSVANRKLANLSCADHSFEIVSYKPRYASGYGNIEMKKPQPNQWLLTIKDKGIHRTFTLSEDIMKGDVTNPVKLEFCNGIWGTRYLNVN